MRPDCCRNLKVQDRIVRQSEVERLLFTAGANSKGTEILHFSEFSLSFQTLVISDVSFWRALSCWLHSRKKCSKSSILWPQIHNCGVLADSLYGWRCRFDSCSNIQTKLIAVFLRLGSCGFWPTVGTNSYVDLPESVIFHFLCQWHVQYFLTKHLQAPVVIEYDISPTKSHTEFELATFSLSKSSLLLPSR